MLLTSILLAILAAIPLIRAVPVQTPLGNIDCNFKSPLGGPWDPRLLQKQIDHINKDKAKDTGNASLDPGPGFCSRISCSHDAAISLCNDKTVAQSFPWSAVVNHVNNIHAQCYNQLSADDYMGRQIDPAGWRVVLHSDKC